MFRFVAPLLCLFTLQAHADPGRNPATPTTLTVPWGGLAARADAVLFAPDLRAWMAKFDAALRPTLVIPTLADKLAPLRNEFRERVGFDPFSAPPDGLKPGLGAFSFSEGKPLAVVTPNTADPSTAGPSPDTSRCVDLKKADLVLISGLPGRTLDRSVTGCTTVRIDADKPNHHVLWLDQSSALAGIGLLAPLFPRDANDAAFRAVGTDAGGIVRVRTAPAARGMLRPLIVKGDLPLSIRPLFEAHFGDEFVIAAGKGQAPARMLIRLRDPKKAAAGLDLLGPTWGGLRGPAPFWNNATMPPSPGYAAIHGEYLVIGTDVGVEKPPSGDYRDRLDPGMRARAASALAFVDLDVGTLDVATLLASIPAGAAPGLDSEVVLAALRDVSRLSVAVGLNEGAFWLRFRADLSPLAAARPPPAEAAAPR